jgi:hypothetical protein
MPHISSAVRPAAKGTVAFPITLQKLPNEIVASAKSTYCDVVFGSPSMDCNGTGICKITGTNSVRHLHLKKDCRLTLGQIAALPNGGVSLFFFREFLCIQLYRQHFHKGVLEMKEPCRIPSDIAKALALNAKKLLPGKYAVNDCGGFFRVDFDCA